MQLTTRLSTAIWLIPFFAAIGCMERSPNVASAPPTKHSASETKDWLEIGVPKLLNDFPESPVSLSEGKIVHNEFVQEVFSVHYERPQVVRAMASQLIVVLLPTSGTRREVYVQPGILTQPQNQGTFSGITEGLLNHRGNLNSGVRVYMEMRLTGIGNTNGKGQRVSDVIWIGSQNQLANAIKMGDPAEAKVEGVNPPKLSPAPTITIKKGTPLWMRVGDRWARGFAFENETAGEIQLLIYLVRRDKPYLPWLVTVAKEDLRIEPDAAEELKSKSYSFNDIADENESKLRRHGVPSELKPASVSDLKVGTPVLDFWNGMLDPCKIVGLAKNGTIAIRREGLDNAESVKLIKDLYLDPFGVH